MNKKLYPQMIFNQLDVNSKICTILDIFKIIVDAILFFVTWYSDKTSILMKILALMSLVFLSTVKVTSRLNIYFALTKIKKEKEVQLKFKRLISIGSWVIIVLYFITIGLLLLLLGLAVVNNKSNILIWVSLFSVSILSIIDTLVCFFLKERG